MKTCNKCGIEKPFDQFDIRSRAKGTYQPYCKPCRKAASAEKYATSPEYRQKLVQNHKARTEANRQYLYNYLQQHPCVGCGETDPIVLDFDHLDPSTKTDDISNLAKGCSIETLDAEIAKCRVLCANCHRRHTYKQLGWKSRG